MAGTRDASPSGETVEAHYDAIAREYESKLGSDTINRRHLESCRAAFKSVLGSGFGRTLGVELGVGTGLFTGMMANGFDRLVAVDISRRMLDILSKRLADARIVNVTVVKGDVMHLDGIPESSADVIYFFGLLEHMADPEGLFREAARRLKPGGRIVGVVSNAQCPYYALRRLLPSSRRFFDGVRLYRAAEIRRIAAAAGLQLHALRYWGSVPAQFPDGLVSTALSAAERLAAATPFAWMLGGMAFRCDRPV